MPDIVISEFMDAEALESLRADYEVLQDFGLWQRPDDLKSAVATARALIVRNRTQVTADVLAAAPTLKVVGRLGVGLDNIDLEAARALGIEVCPALGGNTISVAEYVIATALILLRGAYGANAAILAGAWPRQEAIGREAHGKTIGVIGFGEIGQAVATRARALGLRVAACDAYLPAEDLAWGQVDARLALDELLAQADIVTLHVPLTNETRSLIGYNALQAMRNGAILINSARGGIVDEAALAQALKSGHLAGAALDVFATEPLTADAAQVFAGVPNLILTPHIAGVTIECNARVSTLTAENVCRLLEGAL